MFLPPPARRLRRAGLPVAALSALALVLTACSTSTAGSPAGTTSSTQSSGASSSASSSSAAPSSSASSTTKPPKPKIPVHIRTLNADGAQYGVGMPVIAFFSRTPKSAKAFQNATKVTVNGKTVHGAWYFEQSTYYRGYPVEAHYRLQNYWPAHSHVHVDLPMKGVSAGGNMAYNDSLTLDFTIGASHILTVSNRTHRLTAVFDGRTEGTYPVSLGASNTPTKRGVKVIMEKGRDISMRGPGYFDAHVKWTQRLTYDGEYLHSAPWNCVGAPGCVGPQNNIGSGDSSNGCTNLRPDDAEKLYKLLEVGDVVNYPDATGPRMQIGQGYGDWNIFWSQWQTGGMVSTQR